MKWTKWKSGDLMTVDIEFQHPGRRELKENRSVVVIRQAKPTEDANRNWCRLIQVYDPTEEMTYNVIEVKDAPGREGMGNQPGYYRHNWAEKLS